MATNPYLQDQANAITQTATQNLNNNILPGINGGAMVAGGYGGSRQGIAQGNAIGQTNEGITNSLANLYGTSYQADQANQTQQSIAAQQAASQQSIASMQNATTAANNANNYNLGLGNLGLGYTQAGNTYNLGLAGLGVTAQGQNQNFYTQNRQLDQSGQTLGMNLANAGNAGMVGAGAGVASVGTAQQQAPWTALNNASSIYSPYTGYGQTSTNTAQGSPAGAALGGAIAGSTLMNLGLGGTATTGADNSTQMYIKDPTSGQAVLNPNYRGY